MTKVRQKGLFLFLVGSMIFAIFGFANEHMTSGAMVDFRTAYYSVRCLLQHHDPYSTSDVVRVYQEEEIEHHHPDPILPGQVQDATVFVYFPTATFFMAPIAELNWNLAHILWMILTVTSLILAAWLVWSIGARYEPVISGRLVCLLLVGSIYILEIGNAAAIVVSLCIVSVWCFVQQKFVATGVVCLAISLLIKPQDAGFVWLYFLLAGGMYRRHALQTLAVATVLGLPGIAWVTHVAPQWMQELHSQLLAASMHGGLSDPTPQSVCSGTAAMITSLQTVTSVFWEDPRIYNGTVYLVLGVLLAVWSVTTLLSRVSAKQTWLALAAIAALSMLPIYHRPTDAKLMLLAVPACAMLWAETEHRAIRWTALLLTAASLSGEIPIALLVAFTKSLHLPAMGLTGQILTVLLARPAPLILLATGSFYLWLYVRGALIRSVSIEPA